MKKSEFDAVLVALIRSKPTSLEEVKAMPRLKKDGTPKRRRKPAKRTRTA
jgi:hypothetical protein